MSAIYDNGLEEPQVTQIASSVEIPFDETNFTQYDDLSKEQVLGWVESTVSEETVQNLKKELVSRFIITVSPTTVIKVPPWAIPEII